MKVAFEGVGVAHLAVSVNRSTCYSVLAWPISITIGCTVFEVARINIEVW
jgi:hypothetical protein